MYLRWFPCSPKSIFKIQETKRMTSRDIARKLVDSDTFPNLNDENRCQAIMLIELVIAQAEQRGYERGLDEAAKVAETVCCEEFGDGVTDVGGCGMNRVAKTIRNKLNESKGKGE